MCTIQVGGTTGLLIVQAAALLVIAGLAAGMQCQGLPLAITMMLRGNFLKLFGGHKLKANNVNQLIMAKHLRDLTRKFEIRLVLLISWPVFSIRKVRN